MLPVYNLVVDITTMDTTIEEEEFRELISPCLTYLDALKGAFDRKPCAVVFFPPENQDECPKGWSVRCVLMISVGKKRAEYLMQLYQAIVYLIGFELPDLEVRAESSQFQFS